MLSHRCKKVVLFFERSATFALCCSLYSKRTKKHNYEKFIHSRPDPDFRENLCKKIIETEEFRAWTAILGQISKSFLLDYHLEISGNPEAFENFSYKISRHSLELRSKHEGVDFSKVSIKIFVPDIEAIRMSNGGKLTMG